MSSFLQDWRIKQLTMSRGLGVLLLIGLLGRNDGAEMVPGQKSVIWLNHSPLDNKAHVFLYRGDPALWLPELIRSTPPDVASFSLTRQLGNNDFERASADFWEDSVIVSNSKGNYIESLPTYFRKGKDITFNVTSGTLGTPKGLAVDWVNKHVYWTDPQLNIIGMASYKTIGRQRIVHAGVGTPMAIAVNPLEGYLYWFTSGGTAGIVRSNMLGTDTPTSIVTRHSAVTAMIVDYKNGDLYYVDNYRKVYTCDKDGQGERVLSGVWNDTKDYTIADIALFESYLIVSAKEKMFFDIYDKNTSDFLARVNGADLGRRPTAITVSAPERQPKLTGTANGCEQSNGNCRQFCVQHGHSGHSCECDFGFQLQDDGITCLPPAPVIRDNFLLVGDSLHRDIFQIDLTSSARDQADKAHALPLGDILDPVAITYDANNRLIYWTNTDKEFSIHEATLEGHGHRKILQLGVEISRIAFREAPRRVYFTAGGSIEWISPESGDRESIYNADPLQNTRGLALDHRTNLVYWSECDLFIGIYSADVDTLNNRRILMDFRGGRVVCPYDIALDLIENKIYWVDGSNDYTHAVVERADMDGTNREMIYDVSTTTALLYALTLDSRLVYLTDRHSRTVITIDKVSRAVSSIGYPFHGVVNGVYLHNATYNRLAGASPPPTPSQTPTGSTTVEFTRPSPTFIKAITSIGPEVVTHDHRLEGEVVTQLDHRLEATGSTLIIAAAAGGGGVLVVLIIAITVGVICCVRSSRRRGNQVNSPVTLAIANAAYVGEASAAPVVVTPGEKFLDNTYLTTGALGNQYETLDRPPPRPPRLKI